MTKCKRCDTASDTPFCPTCGAKLVDNEFIGLSRRQLERAYDDVTLDLRRAATSIKRLERHHSEEIQGAKKQQARLQLVLQKAGEAREWAEEHGIWSSLTEEP